MFNACAKSITLISSRKPPVAFRETITQRADFCLHAQKAIGGACQYTKVVGYIKPVEPDLETGNDVAFESVVMGGNIPTNFIPAIEKVTVTHKLPILF